MKSRNFESTYFTDPYIQGLKSVKQRFGYIYFLYNKAMNWLGCYELTDRTALFEIGEGMNNADLQECKQQYQKDKKILYLDDFVLVVNSEKHEKHLGNKQLMLSAYKQFLELPDKVKVFFLKNKPKDVSDKYINWFKEFGFEIDKLDLDIRLDSNLPSNLPVGYSVDEVEIINNKIINNNISNTTDISISPVHQKILDKFNEIYKTKYQSLKAIEANVKYWLSVYSLDDILRAIEKSKRHKFWGDKLTPTLLFRTKDKTGEIDKIGEFLQIPDPIKYELPQEDRGISPGIPIIDEKQRAENLKAIAGLKAEIGKTPWD